jgi:hypothetical protein
MMHGSVTIHITLGERLVNYTNSIDSTDFVGDHRPLQCRRP